MLSIKPNKHRYFIVFAFNGKRFHGWQVQPNAITVQEVMNKAVSTIIGTEVNLVGAGRTDTGVHASYFVAHFDTTVEILDLPGLVYRLNRFLGRDIRIDVIVGVGDDTHARFSAVSRTYHYLISRKKAPFMGEFSWEIGFDLDFGSMQYAAGVLLDYEDFTSFARLHADTDNNICRLIEASWQKKGGFWVFTIRANRFLRNMVRAIVGTLVDVGAGKTDLQGFRNIIESLDRSKAGQSAPPQGLFLTHIEYPADLFTGAPEAAFCELF